MAKDSLHSLTDIAKALNHAWRQSGQTGKVVLSSDNIEITEEEVKLKFMCEMIVTVSKDKFDLSTLHAVNPAVSPAVSDDK